MWKKGINKQNTAFHRLIDAGWATMDLDMSIINGFINKPVYYDAKDAINEFEKSQHLESAALSPRISIKKNGTIYIDTIAVGRYSYEKKHYSVKKIFTPEVKAVFQNIPSKVL
jgi:hypothetical protein